MAQIGVKTTDLAAEVQLDEVLGNRNGGSARVPVNQFIQALMGAGPLKDFLDGITATFETVALMVASTTLAIGDVVYVADGRNWKIVAAGTGVADGVTYIDLETYQAEKITSFTGGATVDLDLLATNPPSIMTGPIENWTRDSTADSSELLKPAVIDELALITNDPIYGHCLEFQDGINLAVGPAFPEFSHPDDVWELRGEYKVIAEDTINGGLTNVRLGVTVQDGLTVTDRNKNTTTIYGKTMADGPQQLIARFAKRTLPVVAGIDNVILPNGGNRLYAHITQNVAGVSNGRIRVGGLHWENITALINAQDVQQTFAVLTDEKADNINSGDTTANVWNTRELNTEDDPDGIVSLAANEFTPNVDCFCDWVIYGTDRSVSRLYNVTDGALAHRGTNAMVGSLYYTAMTGSGKVIAGKTYRIEHMPNVSRNPGGGYAFNGSTDTTNVYTKLTLRNI